MRSRMIGDGLVDDWGLFGRIDVIFTALEISSTMMNVLIENFIGCGKIVVLISGDSFI